jgi:hypothetical protein
MKQKKQNKNIKNKQMQPQIRDKKIERIQKEA